MKKLDHKKIAAIGLGAQMKYFHLAFLEGIERKRIEEQKSLSKQELEQQKQIDTMREKLMNMSRK